MTIVIFYYWCAREDLVTFGDPANQSNEYNSFVILPCELPLAVLTSTCVGSNSSSTTNQKWDYKSPIFDWCAREDLNLHVLANTSTSS